MATASVVDTAPATRVAARSRSRWRDDLVTVLLGLWLLLGLALDGWAHENLRQLETFFTPWHGMFYSGYGASAAWLCWLIWRERRAGRVGLAAIPPGYELGLAGVLVGGVGGLGDLLWHLAFGIEQNREALLSPTHLLLFVGLLLIVTSPFRSAWASVDVVDDAPSLVRFLPPLLSLTAATGFAVFFNGYLWAFIDVLHRPADVAPLRGVRVALRLARDFNLATILISNALLMAPVLLLLRRWRPPFGSVTILFTAVTFLASAVFAFRFAEYIVVGLLAGLAADALIRLLRPWPGRPWALRLFAFATPGVLWGLYFLVTRWRAGEAWSPELWVGITVMAGLGGVGLSLLTVPPALPSAPAVSGERPADAPGR